MGWASGVHIMRDIIVVAKKHVPDFGRTAFYVEIIKVLESEDWDTANECLGEDIFYDEAFGLLNVEKIHNEK